MTPDQPRHIAIIMDGNGRWAKQRGLPRIEGHRRGVETVRKIVRAAGEMDLEFLTLYSFSTENWKRPQSEVTGLMQLFRIYIRRNLKELKDQNVRVQVIGERDGLDDDILDWIDKSVSETKDNTGLTLILAFNYGSRQEMARAADKCLKDIQAGKLSPDELSEDLFASYLDTDGTPNPELVIRTSGEQRISNFLLWQAAEAELYFTDVLWPDFTPEDLQAAISGGQ